MANATARNLPLNRLAKQRVPGICFHLAPDLPKVVIGLARTVPLALPGLSRRERQRPECEGSQRDQGGTARSDQPSGARQSKIRVDGKAAVGAAAVEMGENV